METYIAVSNSKNGKLAISSSIFSLLANEILDDLIENKYKDQIVKSYLNKESKAVVSVSHSKVNINCLIFLNDVIDLKKLITDIRNCVYEGIHSKIEIPNLYINVKAIKTK